MTQLNALMIIDPLKSIEDAKNRRAIVVTLRERSILREGSDYGVVPGSNKPTLLKPGAERLCAAFGFDPRFEILDKVERWEPESPLFFYQVVCHLIHIDSGSEVATGVGSCNSMESKYRWRWVDENDVPPALDKATLVSRSSNMSEFDFAIEKAETGGKYGKPAAYWQAFKDAIANGTARRTKRKTNAGKELDAWEIGGASYRIPNDDVFSLVNTIIKMACKRALVAATLIGANASEFFTQDVEDMPGFSIAEDYETRALPDNAIEGTFTEVTVEQPSASVRGAGVQKPLTAWADDPAQLDAFYASALDKFSFTKVTVTETLDALDSLEFADWRTSRGWALAALVAEYCNNDVVKIDEYTSGMGGNEDAALTLRDRARQIAVTNAQNVGVLL